MRAPHLFSTSIRPSSTAVRIGLSAFALASLAACSGTSTDSEAESTSTATTTATSTTQPTTTQAPLTTSVIGTTNSPLATTPVAAEVTPAAAPAIMPNVVCMNLQDAQDTIQSSGVFFSRSADATGAGRRQLVDSNWIVVDQTPSAGSPFGEIEAVLSAVKIGEPNPC
ncbi:MULTISPECIES: PASTA domain-containing protein [Rhodococcus]|uniref:PASTA domain-containing protein n=1 Tax=Rhodococcus qingshengii JCM 15477 TaxID=1303681 RepID=A0AB38RBS3_RHOSG|nr:MULTISPECIES: PASTA domain-containing protein [Rhodococcus]UPU42544.1 PASTA domain-containing protein [Rhodococcus qingshengii JCM 15477]